MVHSLSIFVSSVGHMVYLFHIRLQIPTKSNAFMYDSKNLIKIEKHISISSVHGKTLHGITTLSWPTTRFKSGQSRVSVIHFQVLPVQKWKKNNFPGQIPTCSFLQHLFLLAEPKNMFVNLVHHPSGLKKTANTFDPTRRGFRFNRCDIESGRTNSCTQTFEGFLKNE